jgi:signal transduction histidine kinase
MFRKAILLIVWIFSFYNILYAQISSFGERYTVSQYTDENGLPQNSVKSIATDKLGFVWLATENGMVRFDGLHFYSFDKSNVSIRDSRFAFFLPDLNGNEARTYAVASGSMLRIENGIARADSVYTRQIHERLPFLKENDHKRFLALGSPNSHFVDSSIQRFSICTILSTKGKGSFYSISADKTEFYTNWVKKWELPAGSPDFQNYFSLKGTLYQLLHNGTIKTFTEKGTVSMGIEGDIKTDPTYRTASQKMILYWNNVSDQACLLLGKRFYHLTLMPGGKWISKLILDGFDFESNNIRTFHYDPDKERLFLGSLARGLFIIAKKKFNTIRVGEKDDDNVLYGLAVSTRKEIISPRGDVFQKLTGHAADRKILPRMKKEFKGDLRSILTDRKGNIWVKSFEYLYQFDSTGNTLLREWAMQDEIKTLYEGLDGKIWIGFKKAGLYYMDSLSVRPTLFVGTPIPNISYMLQTKPDTLWIATFNGLYSVRLSTKKVIRVPDTEKLYVKSLFVSPAVPDGLFFTAHEDGVFFYKAGKLVAFPLDGSRNLATAHCITEDQKGFFWIPTNKGLFRFARYDLLTYAQEHADGTSRGKLFYDYFTRENGFNTNEFNGGYQPCAVKLADGRILLPSLNGLVWFDPLQIGIEVPNRDFIIDRYEADGNSMPLTGSSVYLQNDPRQINFYISVPFFGNGNSRQIDYSIAAADEKEGNRKWIPLRATDPVIRFSSLESGEYVLTVRKMGGFGRDNYTIKRLRIVVPPRWYETTLFGFLCVLVAIGLGTLYLKLRVRYLIKANQHLESVISDRTSELQQMLTALRVSEKDLSKQMHIHSRLVASISHDVRTPLKFALYAVGKMKSLIRDKDYNRVAELNDSMESAISGMYNLIANLTEYMRTQVYHDRVQRERVDLSEVVSAKAALFSTVIKENQNTLSNEVTAGLTVLSDANLLAIVIHNLIDNANKYTFSGHIRIFTAYTEKDIHLVIKDEGAGIPGPLAAWLNTQSSRQTLDFQSTGEQYKGLGLIIVKEISALLSIRLFVEVKQGTAFHLIFNRP